jgi:hypothetical protein
MVTTMLADRPKSIAALENADLALRLLDSPTTRSARVLTLRLVEDAYKAVIRDLPALRLTTEERILLNKKVALIRLRLFN